MVFRASSIKVNVIKRIIKVVGIAVGTSTPPSRRKQNSYIFIAIVFVTGFVQMIAEVKGLFTNFSQTLVCE